MQKSRIKGQKRFAQSRANLVECRAFKLFAGRIGYSDDLHFAGGILDKPSLKAEFVVPIGQPEGQIADRKAKAALQRVVS